MTDSSSSREPAAGPCARLAADLDEWLDRALSDAEAAATAEHLARCPPCAERVRHEQRFRDVLHRCGRPAPAPESLAVRVRAVLRAGRPPDAAS